jgi:hypothetical protein
LQPSRCATHEEGTRCNKRHSSESCGRLSTESATLTAQVTRLVRLAEVGAGTKEACEIETEFLQGVAERYRDAVRGW